MIRRFHRQTLERRQRQQANNEALGIVPKTIVKALPVMGGTEDELVAGTTTAGDGSRRLIAKKGGRRDGDWAQRLNLGAGAWGSTEKKPIEHSNSQLTYDEPDDLGAHLSKEDRAALIEEIRDAMQQAAKDLDLLRDRTSPG